MSKVALVLFGVPRCSRVTLPSIIENIISPLEVAGHAVAGYYHYYQIDKIVNLRSAENSDIDQNSYLMFHDMPQFDGLIEPGNDYIDAAEFEKLKLYGDSWADDFRSLRNLLLQLRSIALATKLAERSNPDAFVFIRPDLLYHDKLDPSLVQNVATEPDKVYLPNWQWWGGYNDRLALCGNRSYARYAFRGIRVLDYCGKYGALHSERLVKFVLSAPDVRVRCLERFTASRVRANGAIKPEQFSKIRGMGRPGVIEAALRSWLR